MRCDKWFFQAISAPRAVFRRDTHTGSLCWLGVSDRTGAYLDSGHSYTLTVPLPVPLRLFWSVIVYDARTRSQLQTDQDKALLRSLFDVADTKGNPAVDLYFGRTSPSGYEHRWVQTLPGVGWFVYVRFYGPEQAAFDQSWKPGDFELVAQPSV